MNHLKAIAVGVLALGLSLPAWADMTKAEAIAKVEESLSRVHAQERNKWVAAVEALLKAGVAPETCVDVVESALAHKVSAADVAKQARRIESRARGDKAAAAKHARDYIAFLEKRQDARRKLREEVRHERMQEQMRDSKGPPPPDMRSEPSR